MVKLFRLWKDKFSVIKMYAKGIVGELIRSIEHVEHTTRIYGDNPV
jgi:hypothetical protein